MLTCEELNRIYRLPRLVVREIEVSSTCNLIHQRLTVNLGANKCDNRAIVCRINADERISMRICIAESDCHICTCIAYNSFCHAVRVRSRKLTVAINIDIRDELGVALLQGTERRRLDLVNNGDTRVEFYRDCPLGR